MVVTGDVFFLQNRLDLYCDIVIFMYRCTEFLVLKRKALIRIIFSKLLKKTVRAGSNFSVHEHIPVTLPGLFSSIMRELANITHDGPKWMVLDGDIDPMWIESLNTVMDDNKVGNGSKRSRYSLTAWRASAYEKCRW